MSERRWPKPRLAFFSLFLRQYLLLGREVARDFCPYLCRPRGDLQHHLLPVLVVLRVVYRLRPRPPRHRGAEPSPQMLLLLLLLCRDYPPCRTSPPPVAAAALDIPEGYSGGGSGGGAGLGCAGVTGPPPCGRGREEEVPEDRELGREHRRGAAVAPAKAELDEELGRGGRVRACADRRHGLCRCALRGKLWVWGISPAAMAMAMLRIVGSWWVLVIKISPRMMSSGSDPEVWRVNGSRITADTGSNSGPSSLVRPTVASCHNAQKLRGRARGRASSGHILGSLLMGCLSQAHISDPLQGTSRIEILQGDGHAVPHGLLSFPLEHVSGR